MRRAGNLGGVDDGSLRHTLDTARPGLTVLTLVGTLDATRAPVASAALARAEGVDGAAIALDVRGLRLADADGLGVLVEADARARSRGRRLALVADRAEIMRALADLGVTAAFQIVDTPEALLRPERT